MLDPRTIMVAVPCHDGRLMCETAGSLITCQGMYAAVSFPPEVSHVSLVRNYIAGIFLDSPFEWLICIDSDISFSRADMEFLLQPCDASTKYEPLEAFAPSNLPPRPTRVLVKQPTDRADLESAMLSAADVLVTAEYPFKSDSLEPIKFGMGFVRIHRSVFETLQGLKHDGGPMVEVRRDLMERLRGIHFGDGQGVGYPREDVEALLRSVDDKAGQGRLWQTSWKGRLYYDYFPSGPILSQFVPSAEWKGEDKGFFSLCMLAGIVPRIETRTRLTHIGRKAYQYLGPDMGGGQ